MAQRKHRITLLNQHPRIRMPRDPVITDLIALFSAENILEADVTVILTTDEHLLELNRSFLNHDYYTDVLTFPLEDAPLEGEIYISVERARDQAMEFGVGLYKEIRRLAIHGALHLTGYDDATEGDRRRMTLLEDRYLGI